jgi:GDPmannose 4,6-dehydratase
MYFLSAISDLRPECRFFFASSSNIFGFASTEPQNERTDLSPDSIYGVTKVAGMHLVRLHRVQKGLYGCSGILFNHESPRRDLNYLPKKITSTAAKIRLGLETKLELGDLDARRDWGFAGDYVEAMWLSLQAEKPDDYVIGTGETHTVRDILDIVFGLLDLDWKQYVKVNPALVRPKNPTIMVADITKISATLGWKPKTKFSELMRMMIEEDMRLARVS